MKLRIMSSIPELSDQEIQEWMDFNQLVKQHQHQAARRRKTYTLYAAGGILLLAGVAAWYFYQSYTLQNAGPSQVQVLAPVTISPKTPSLQPKQEVKKTIAQQPIKERKEKPVVLAQKQPEQNTSIANATPEKYLEAVPVEGYPHLYEYFSREQKYPSEAIRDSISGVVTLQFMIDVNGKPTHLVIENSLGPLFDQEATRLIEHMPAWHPATLNGHPRASRLSIPLTFRIEKSK